MSKAIALNHPPLFPPDLCAALSSIFKTKAPKDATFAKTKLPKITFPAANVFAPCLPVGQRACPLGRKCNRRGGEWKTGFRPNDDGTSRPACQLSLASGGPHQAIPEYSGAAKSCQTMKRPAFIGARRHLSSVARQLPRKAGPPAERSKLPSSVETSGLEPPTPGLQSRCSPN